MLDELKTKNNRSSVTWFVLFGCSIAYNFYLLKTPIDLYDEGLVLSGADRILKGQLPYMDFWSVYPPGQYYVLAFIFKLFGTSLLSERLYDLLIRSLLSTSIFLIIKKLGVSNVIAIIGWGTALVWLGHLNYSAYPVYIAILLMFCSAYILLHYIETNQPFHLVYAGACITLSALFRHDLAGMAAVGMLITVFLKKSADTETRFYPASYFTLGMLSAGLPILIYLIINVGVYTIVNQLLVAPAKLMPEYRWLPYPTRLAYSSIPFYVYPFFLFAGLLASCVFIFRLKTRSRLSYGLFLLSLIGILFINQARVRSGYSHVIPAILLGAVVGPTLFYTMVTSSLRIHKPRLAKIAIFVFAIIIIAPLGQPIYKKMKSVHSNYFALPEASQRTGYSSIDTNLQNLIVFIRDNTDESDAIYVGVKNHDQFILNDTAVYFLAGREYATKYHELHPGVTTTLNVQKEIVQELIDSGAKLIVLTKGYWFEPNGSALDAGIELLDEYIVEHYRLARTFGVYQVYVLRTSG